MVRFIFLFFLVLSLFGREVPRLSGPVVDEASVLSRKEVAVLSQGIRSLYRSSGNQFQILILDSLSGESVEGFSIRVAEKWKLGGEKKDAGVLLLMSAKERKIRIEVGGGLEGDLPDAYVGRVIRQIMGPAFKKGAYFSGFASALTVMSDKLGTPITFKVSTRGRKRRRGGFSFFFLFILFIIFRGIFGRRHGASFAGGLLLGSLLGGSRSSGGFGGGSFSDWSGGGGSFSGGGASGDF